MHLVFSKILKYALQTFLRLTQCASSNSKFIIVHGSHSHDLYWIYALLSRNQPCRDYALWEALFGQNWWEEAQKHFRGPGQMVLVIIEILGNLVVLVNRINRVNLVIPSNLVIVLNFVILKKLVILVNRRIPFREAIQYDFFFQ